MQKLDLEKGCQENPLMWFFQHRRAPISCLPAQPIAGFVIIRLVGKKIQTIKDAQKLVKSFAKRNKWRDIPNVDKFDHLHEELIEMSQHLRYKTEKERVKFVRQNKEIFVDGIGDLFFALCRLANQLGVDIEEAFNLVKEEILSKYNHRKPENNIVKEK